MLWDFSEELSGDQLGVIAQLVAGQELDAVSDLRNPFSAPIPCSQGVLVGVQFAHEREVVGRAANADDDKRNREEGGADDFSDGVPLVLLVNVSIGQNQEDGVLHIILTFIRLNSLHLLVDLLNQGREVGWAPHFNNLSSLHIGFQNSFDTFHVGI